MSRTSDRQSRRERRRRSPLESIPFTLLRNPLPPTELLSPEQSDQIHEASMWLLENVGLDFLDAEALDLWEAAGAKVDRAAEHVWLDRDLVLELVARAPSSFTLHARNPARNLVMGGNHVSFLPCLGTPFVADLDNGRRPGTLDACRDLIRVIQMCTPLHGAGGYVCTPQDIAVPLRHLELDRAQYMLSDRTSISPAYGRSVSADCVEMAAIVFGGHEALRQKAVLTSLINVNSPLRYDSGMLGGLITYARAGQPLIVTPFILAGAMSPVTMAAALAQQNAEALAGIALTQLVNPGVPVIYGGFTTNTDLATGGPAFGTPESAWAIFAGAQLARRYKLPFRSSGGLNTAKLPDAQAAYETQMCLWPCVMSHTNYVLHAAGWLEGGLVASFEKLIIDCEQLAMFQHLLAGTEISSDTLALESIKQVGPGGHHFGTPHTLERYESVFYRPIISDRQNLGAWQDQGGLDAAQRANKIWKELLAVYEEPALDPGVQQALDEFVARRTREIVASGVA